MRQSQKLQVATVIFILLFGCVSLFGQNPVKSQCKATTKSGAQCKRKAINNDLCSQHFYLSSVPADTSKVYTGKQGGKYRLINGKKVYLKR